MVNRKMRIRKRLNSSIGISLFCLMIITAIAFFPGKNHPLNSNLGTSINPFDDFTGTISPEAFVFEGVVQASSTGWNSNQTQLVFNPQTGHVLLTWLDYFAPFTSNAETTLYYSFGNETTSWATNLFQVKNINGTLLSSIDPAYDANDAVHLVYSNILSHNFDLNETLFLNEANKQDETNLIATVGNSTLPAVITDHKGFIHLVWRDTVTNPNGDLFYTFYNATSGTWNASSSQITTGASVVADSSLALTVDENNTLHLIWADNRTTDQELYYSYLEEGSTWTTEEKITAVAYSPFNPKLAYDENSKKLQLIFRDTGTSNNLYYMTATAKTGGAGWSTPSAISSLLATKGGYDICTDSYGNAILVFERNDGARNNIYLRYKNSNATSWGALEIISSLTTPAYAPSVTVSDEGTVYIAYTELKDGKTEVFIRYGLLDSDGDGLSDLDEINLYGTDPYNADTDGDSLSDGDEITLYQTNPLSSDSDNDQMPDNYEINYAFDPLNASDATLDVDKDNLTNLQEYTIGTNPVVLDTDLDYLSDGQEYLTYHTDPLDPDSDGDSLLDGYEAAFGLNPLVADDVKQDPDNDGLTTEFESIIWTDPTNPDTDGDGVNDGQEVSDGTDPLDPTDFKIPQATGNSHNIIIGILVAVGTISLFLMFAVVIARQFKPKKATKRKELEREEAQYSEKATFTAATKPKFEFQLPATREKERLKKETMPPTTTPTTPSEPAKKEEAEPVVVKKPEPTVQDERIILEKKEALQKAIVVLQNYEESLNNMLKKQLTPFNVSTITREALTEYAADSQTLLSEAKETWTGTILPLIKGYEEQLYTDTLEAEKILDNCKAMSDKIL